MLIRDQSDSGSALGFTADIDLQLSIKNKMELAMYSNWWLFKDTLYYFYSNLVLPATIYELLYKYQKNFVILQ